MRKVFLEKNLGDPEQAAAVNNSKVRNCLFFRDNEQRCTTYSPVIHKSLRHITLCKKSIDGIFALMHDFTSSLKARESTAQDASSAQRLQDESGKPENSRAQLMHPAPWKARAIRLAVRGMIHPFRRLRGRTRPANANPECGCRRR